MKTAAEYASLNSNPQLDWTSSFEDRRDFIQSIIDTSVAHGMTIAAEQELNEARLRYEVLLRNYNADTISLVASERDQLRKVCDELADFIKGVVSEHHVSMQEARDIGYSDGMFLKPSFAIKATNCERIYDQLPHIQERKMK